MGDLGILRVSKLLMAAEGVVGDHKLAATLRSYAELLSAVPQPILEVNLPVKAPKIMDGEVCVIFSKEEIQKSVEPFSYSLVLKFLRQRPSLDVIRGFIKNRWGLPGNVVASAMMRLHRNVFVRLTSEEDFNKAFSREVCDINGMG